MEFSDIYNIVVVSWPLEEIDISVIRRFADQEIKTLEYHATYSFDMLRSLEEIAMNAVKVRNA